MNNILNKAMPAYIKSIYDKIIVDLGRTSIELYKSTNKQSYVIKESYNYYKIYLNTDLPEEYFWEIFLHEHIHIIQYRQGYSELVSRSEQNLAYILTDVLADIDVNARLENYGFQRCSYHGKDKILKSLKIKTMSSSYDIRELSALSVLLDVCYHTSDCFTFSSILCQDQVFDNYYTQFTKIINDYPDTTATHMRSKLILSARLFQIKNPTIR